MPYGYSDDLRERALKYYDRGHKQVEVCDVFEISRATLNNWLVKRREGDYRRRARQQPRGSHKLDDGAVAAYIDAHPDAYLHEIGLHFGVHASSIFRSCRRLGISRKKKSTV